MIRCQNVRKRIDPRTIRRRTEKLLKHLNLPDASVSIFLCDDTLIRELNRTYRNKNKPTDVLSFSMNEGERMVGDSSLLGDIIVSVDTAARQAPVLGHTLIEETTSLVIHGLLHLLGYDHINARDSKEMDDKTQELSALFPYKNHN